MKYFIVGLNNGSSTTGPGQCKHIILMLRGETSYHKQSRF